MRNPRPRPGGGQQRGARRGAGGGPCRTSGRRSARGTWWGGRTRGARPSGRPLVRPTSCGPTIGLPSPPRSPSPASRTRALACTVSAWATEAGPWYAFSRGGWGPNGLTGMLSLPPLHNVRTSRFTSGTTFRRRCVSRCSCWCGTWRCRVRPWRSWRTKCGGFGGPGVGPRAQARRRCPARPKQRSRSCSAWKSRPATPCSTARPSARSRKPSWCGLSGWRGGGAAQPPWSA